mgnify:CR=1 FL=1
MSIYEKIIYILSAIIIVLLIVTIIQGMRIKELSKTDSKEKDTSVVNEDSKKFLVNKGVDINYGARPLRRIIAKELEDKLSEEMLKGCIKGGDNLEIYCDGEELCIKHIS